MVYLLSSLKGSFFKNPCLKTCFYSKKKYYVKTRCYRLSSQHATIISQMPNLFRAGWDFSPEFHDGFLQILKRKQKKGFSSDVGVHKHHIKPLHAGGSADDEVILCTPRDHARIHLVRYLVYQDPGDLAAYCGLSKQSITLIHAISDKIVAINRSRKNNVFGLNFQQEMAKRSADKRRGQKLSSETLQKRKTKKLYIENLFSQPINWVHESGIKVQTPPVKNYDELMDHLNQLVPGSLNKKRTSKLGEVLCGTRRGAYGWRLAERKILVKKAEFVGNPSRYKNYSTRQTKIQQSITWKHVSGKVVTSPPMETLDQLQNYLNVEFSLPGEGMTKTSLGKMLCGTRKSSCNISIVTADTKPQISEIKWIHKTGIRTTTPPVESFRDLKFYLDPMVPAEFCINDPGNLGHLLKRTVRSCYGWRLEKNQSIFFLK